jgi:hypothetical protein
VALVAPDVGAGAGAEGNEVMIVCEARRYGGRGWGFRGRRVSVIVCVCMRGYVGAPVPRERKPPPTCKLQRPWRTKKEGRIKN